MISGEGYSNPYSSEQFRVLSGSTSNGFCVVKLIFPQPETNWLCYAAYLIYKPNTRVIGYYTVERSDDNGVPMICTVDMYGSERKRTLVAPYKYADDRLMIEAIARMMDNPDYLSQMETKVREEEDRRAYEKKRASMWVCSGCGRENGEKIFVCKCGMKKSENENKGFLK